MKCVCVCVSQLSTADLNESGQILFFSDMHMNKEERVRKDGRKMKEMQKQCNKSKVMYQGTKCIQQLLASLSDASESEDDDNT